MSEQAENLDRRQKLRADCGRCAGLCCVAPVFAASADFAIDKPAGRPCPNLGADFGCGIHDNLRERGFPGCAVFDCFGAGQQVVQVTFGGRHWRENPASTTSMFTVFTVMRQLHELLWYLAEALALQPAGQLHNELKCAQEESERLTGAGPDELALFDATAHRQKVGPLLERVSQAVRVEVRDRGPDRRGADLIGAKLQGADLRGVSLRGAYLLGADLRGADLRKTDLLGADLRAADLRAAKLDGSIFLTQPQLNAVTGDAATTIPPSLTRPRHWPTSITHEVHRPTGDPTTG
ncbi:MAG: pentapeptide repeat-containing protein [Pseudonocardiaceae bacterium]